MNNLPFSIPIKIDEAYIFDRKSLVVTRMDAYYDVANQKANYKTQFLFPDGSSSYLNSEVTYNIDSVENLGNLVSKENPKRILTINLRGKKYKCHLSLNSEDESQLTMAIGTRYTVIIKEYIPRNFIILLLGLFAGGGGGVGLGLAVGGGAIGLGIALAGDDIGDGLEELAEAIEEVKEEIEAVREEIQDLKENGSINMTVELKVLELTLTTLELKLKWLRDQDSK